MKKLFFIIPLLTTPMDVSASIDASTSNVEVESLCAEHLLFSGSYTPTSSALETNAFSRASQSEINKLKNELCPECETTEFRAKLYKYLSRYSESFNKDSKRYYDDLKRVYPEIEDMSDAESSAFIDSKINEIKRVRDTLILNNALENAHFLNGEIEGDPVFFSFLKHTSPRFQGIYNSMSKKERNALNTYLSNEVRNESGDRFNEYLFSSVNTVFRSLETNQIPIPYRNYMQILESAITKLPRYADTAIRRLKLSPQEIAQYEIGENIQLRGITSAGPEDVQSYVQRLYGTYTNVELHIKCNNKCYDIGIPNNPGVVYQLPEVLLIHGTTVRVTRIIEGNNSSQTVMREGIPIRPTVIELEVQ